MNDPSAQPIDIEEMRSWLIDHREATGFSWSEVSKRVGIPYGTLTQFGGKKGYSGDERKLAEAVFRYRQQLAQQASMSEEMPELPAFYETQTTKDLTQLLHWAKRGRVVVAATGAGCSKTETGTHYTACYPNVFRATMTPSSAGVNNMQIAVLRALGERNPKGTPQALSYRICELVRNMHMPLLIIDEAQHLSEKAIEEIRSWNDLAKLGIAFFGNIKVIKRIEGGGRDDAFAQLYSRLSMRLIRPVPLKADALALAEAWGIFEEPLVNFIVRIATIPGGLRGATFAIELATMIAHGERRPLALDDLQAAWAQLTMRGGAA
jgi:DNA transposition AAA+ family ATPase